MKYISNVKRNKVIKISHETNKLANSIVYFNTTYLITISFSENSDRKKTGISKWNLKCFLIKNLLLYYDDKVIRLKIIFPNIKILHLRTDKKVYDKIYFVTDLLFRRLNFKML